MAQEEQAVALYDFLYRDVGRIASYYAQIFSGRLANLEETDTETNNHEDSGKGSIKVIEAGTKITSGTQTSTKRTIDPHDVITTDVITYLIESHGVREDIVDAPHGSLVLAQGTLSVIDHKILELAISAFEHENAELRKTARTRDEKAAVRTGEMLIKVMQKVQMPSAFLLHLPGGVAVSGTIKEDGMEEIISTYYFKYGSQGVADVYVIGIKEVPTDVPLLAAEQLFSAAQQIAQGFTQALFPPGSIRLTPFALFRRI